MNILRHLRTAFFHPEKEETPRAAESTGGTGNPPGGKGGR